ncbi:hypothetical protein TRIUR3_32345 [Triticum urartu]|uniref:Uncharacterized protein n=1 Tax=Triticum urartu TaxID=4572 RepID=M7ZFZ0_TRIUA|nr:hypothetical protein TRIUR3_32345 [Triticum urartu]
MAKVVEVMVHAMVVELDTCVTWVFGDGAVHGSEWYLLLQTCRFGLGVGVHGKRSGTMRRSSRVLPKSTGPFDLAIPKRSSVVELGGLDDRRDKRHGSTARKEQMMEAVAADATEQNSEHGQSGHGCGLTCPAGAAASSAGPGRRRGDIGGSRVQRVAPVTILQGRAQRSTCYCSMQGTGVGEVEVARKQGLRRGRASAVEVEEALGAEQITTAARCGCRRMCSWPETAGGGSPGSQDGGVAVAMDGWRGRRWKGKLAPGRCEWPPAAPDQGGGGSRTPDRGGVRDGVSGWRREQGKETRQRMRGSGRWGLQGRWGLSAASWLDAWGRACGGGVGRERGREVEIGRGGWGIGSGEARVRSGLGLGPNGPA